MPDKSADQNAQQQTPTNPGAAEACQPQGSASSGLTHFNAAGEAHMVDVGE